MKKKLISILLTLVMILTTVSIGEISAKAEGEKLYYKIVNFVGPKSGEKYKTPEYGFESNYSICELNTTMYWTDKDGKALTADDVFVAGESYTLKCVITKKVTSDEDEDVFVFSNSDRLGDVQGLPIATVYTVARGRIVDGYSDTMTISAEYTVEIPIETVNVSIAKNAAIGMSIMEFFSPENISINSTPEEKTGFDDAFFMEVSASFDMNKLYEQGFQYLLDNGKELDAGGKLETGKRYILGFAIFSAKGYSVEDAKVTLNGKKVTVGHGLNSEGAKYLEFYTDINFIPQTYKVNAKDYVGAYDGKDHSISIKNVKAGSKIEYRTSKKAAWTTKKPTRKNVGKTTVYYRITNSAYTTITGSKTITINPKKTSLVKLTAKSKAIGVTWKKLTAQTTGYELQYSTSSKFDKAAIVKVTKNKTTSKTISKLKASKKYYVRIRTYKTVSGKVYVSGWSKAKSTTTLK